MHPARTARDGEGAPPTPHQVMLGPWSEGPAGYCFLSTTVREVASTRWTARLRSSGSALHLPRLHFFTFKRDWREPLSISAKRACVSPTQHTAPKPEITTHQTCKRSNAALAIRTFPLTVVIARRKRSSRPLTRGPARSEGYARSASSRLRVIASACTESDDGEFGSIATDGVPSIASDCACFLLLERLGVGTCRNRPETPETMSRRGVIVAAEPTRTDTHVMSSRGSAHLSRQTHEHVFYAAEE